MTGASLPDDDESSHEANASTSSWTPPLRLTYNHVVVRNARRASRATQVAQRFQESSDYVGGAVVRLHPDPRVERVVMDATRSFGQPSINGVHTEVIAEDIRAGADRHDIAALYDLDVVDVDAAIQFELIAAAPQAG